MGSERKTVDTGVDRYRGSAWGGRNLRWGGWVAVGVALGAVALHYLPGAGAALEYERQAILGGEVWRLATGHLVHRSVVHLGWDVLAFALLGALCAGRRPRATWAAVAVAALAIPLVLLLFVPELATYRGLSGLDSTLFVLAALLLADEGRRAGRKRELVVPGLALALFAGKVTWEAVTGSAWFAPPAAPGEVVVPLAHLVGALTALAAHLAAWSQSRPRQRSTTRDSSFFGWLTIS